MIERKNGRFTFRVALRDVQGDGGLAIHVHGPTPSSNLEEVLRFDCFDQQPHYHTAWSYRSDPFIPITARDPFAWAIEKLGCDMPMLLAQADAVPMDDTELDALAETLQAIAADGETLLGIRTTNP